MKLSMLASLLLASTVAATAAQAVTFTTALGAPDPGPGYNESIIVDFEAPVAGVAYSGSYTIGTGLVPGFRAPPAGNTTNYFAVPGVNGDAPNLALIDFTNYIAANRAFRTLSFYWGSVDSYNTLEVIGKNNTILRSIVGNEINNPANGNQTDPFSNQRVFLRFADGEEFTGLRIRSGQRAFELDDIAGSAVPEPGTWIMLLAGFAMVGHAVRSRRRLASVSA